MHSTQDDNENSCLKMEENKPSDRLELKGEALLQENRNRRLKTKDARTTVYRIHSDSFSEFCSLPDLPQEVISGGNKSPGKQFKIWRQNLEPASSWLLLIFAIIPVHILVSIDGIAFSMYFVEFTEYFEASKSAVGMIIAVRTVATSLFGLVTSTFISQFSARWVTITGGALLFVTNIISAFAPNLYMLYVTMGVIPGVATSLCSLPAAVLIQEHFTKNRALGGGLGMLGYPLGHLSGPQLVNLLINHYGWKGSVLICSAITANLMVCGASYWHPKSEESANPEVTDSKESVENDGDTSFKPTCRTRCSEFCKDVLNFSVFKDPHFCIFLVSGTLGTYNIVTYLQHIPSKAVAVGLELQDGASLISIYSITAICTRIVVTLVTNMECVNRILFYGVSIMIGGVASFITCQHSFGGLSVASVLHGIAAGGSNTIVVVVLVDIMGMERLPKALAMYSLVSTGFAVLVGPVGGLIYDATSNYDWPFIASGAGGVLGGLLCLSLFLIRYRAKKRDLSDRDTSTEELPRELEDKDTSIPINGTIVISTENINGEKIGL